MKKWPHIIMLAVAVAVVPAAASAQMFDPAGHPLGADRRVSVGLTVPLGGGAESSGKPQLELRAVADHRAAQTVNRENIGWLPRAQSRETRIGVTLSESPQLTIAGREVPEADRKLGISTLGLVAIGVAAAVVVGGLLFIDALEDSSE